MHIAIYDDTFAVQKKEKPIILFDSTTLWFSLSPYKISIIQTKPFISANYIVTRSEGQKSRTTRDRCYKR